MDDEEYLFARWSKKWKLKISHRFFSSNFRAKKQWRKVISKCRIKVSLKDSIPTCIWLLLRGVCCLSIFKEFYLSENISQKKDGWAYIQGMDTFHLVPDSSKILRLKMKSSALRDFLYVNIKNIPHVCLLKKFFVILKIFWLCNFCF